MWEKFHRWRATGIVAILLAIFELPGYLDNFYSWRAWLATIQIQDNISWLLLGIGIIIFFKQEITKVWQRVAARKKHFVGHAESLDLYIGLSQATGSTTPPSFWFQLKHWLTKLLKTTEEKRKAEERQKRLRRYWEVDPKNGRKAARLMLVVDREDAEDIYRTFAPWNDDPEMNRDSTKFYRWAVSFAWAYHLELAGEPDQVKQIMEEAGFAFGIRVKIYWTARPICRSFMSNL